MGFETFMGTWEHNLPSPLTKGKFFPPVPPTPNFDPASLDTKTRSPDLLTCYLGVGALFLNTDPDGVPETSSDQILHLICLCR